MRSLYPLYLSLSVAIPAIQARLRLSGTNRLRSAFHGGQRRPMLHPKKVGTLPSIKGSNEEKQTNEIKIAAPMLDAIEIEGRSATADALLTQRDLA
ncbi:MAG: hypothetical protein KZQ63_18035 [Candidatus Thiodiazotropha sp. (ex Lucinoma aequizonata)]|nr:hypothetical protein [Candidatus Thiodiazotropha sp. (ex Lucinoma aequizonata)]